MTHIAGIKVFDMLDFPKSTQTEMHFIFHSMTTTLNLKWARKSQDDSILGILGKSLYLSSFTASVKQQSNVIGISEA